MILLPFGAGLWGVLLLPALLLLVISVVRLAGLMRETSGQTPGS